MRGDCEAEPDLHAAGVALDRRVEEPLDLGELDDLVEPSADIGSAHPEDGAGQIDVLATGELGMESGTHLEKRGDPAVETASPSVGSVMRDRIFKSVDLPAPFRPMMPDDLAAGDVEAHVSQRPELLSLAPPAEGLTKALQFVSVSRTYGVHAHERSVSLAKSLGRRPQWRSSISDDVSESALDAPEVGEPAEEQ